MVPGIWWEDNRVLAIASIISVAVLALLIFAAVLTYQSSKTLDEVHVLVNSRFTELLDLNQKLREDIEKLGGPEAPKGER